MANFYNRPDYSNQITAADLATLYSAGKAHSPLLDFPSSYFTGKHVNGNRKLSLSHPAYQSQLISGLALDDLNVRQQRGNI